MCGVSDQVRRKRGEGFTDEEDESGCGGRGGEARGDGIHAVDDGGLEVDVEDAEHVDGVEDDSKCNQPHLPPLRRRSDIHPAHRRHPPPLTSNRSIQCSRRTPLVRRPRRRSGISISDAGRSKTLGRSGRTFVHIRPISTWGKK